MVELSSDDSASFGDFLAAARKSLGLTQAQAAEKCGLSPQHWSDLERGRRQPGYALIRKIIDGLGIPCGVFFPDTGGSK